MTHVRYTAFYLIPTPVYVGDTVHSCIEGKTRAQFIRQVAQGPSTIVSSRGGVCTQTLFQGTNSSAFSSHWGRHGWNPLSVWAAAGTTGFWPEEGCGWENALCNWGGESWRRMAMRCEGECGAARVLGNGKNTGILPFSPLLPWNAQSCSMFRCLQLPEHPPKMTILPTWAVLTSSGCAAVPFSSFSLRSPICQPSSLSFLKTFSLHNGMTYWLSANTKIVWALFICSMLRTGNVTVKLQFSWIWMSQASAQQMAKILDF